MKPQLRSLLVLACAVLLSAPSFGQLSDPVPLPGDLDLGPPAGYQRVPAGARGGDQFLVVWEDTRSDLTGTVPSVGVGSGAATDLLGMRFDASGQALDPAPIAIATEPLNQTAPQVAFNGTHWLVVYRGLREAATHTPSGIYARRVALDGTVLDSTPIWIDNDDFVDELDACVVGIPGGWVVSWHDPDHATTLRHHKIARLDTSGAILTQNDLYSSTGNVFPYRARMAYGSGKILFVAGRQPFGTSAGTLGQFVDPVTLQKQGPEMFLSSEWGWPCVASDGTDFYATWRSDQVVDWAVGTRITQAGSVDHVGGQFLGTLSSLLDQRIEVAFDGVDYMAVAEVGGGGSHEVHAFQVSTTGIPASSNPLVLDASSGPIDDAMIAAGMQPGASVAIWSDARHFQADLFGALRSPGLIVPLGSMENTPPSQTDVDLAGNFEQGYLATWLARHGNQHRVMVQRLDGLGNPIGLPEAVGAGSLALHTPTVAWNGSHWLVVWERWSTVATQAGAVVQYRMMAADGTWTTPVRTSSLSGNEPHVAACGDQFLLAASKLTSLDIRRVWALRVNAQGQEAGPIFQVADNYASFPTVGGFSDRWLVVWEQKSTHNASAGPARAIFVDPQGQFIGTDFVALSGTDRTDISIQGDRAVVIGDSVSEVRFTRIDRDGTQPAPTAITMTTAPNSQFLPAIGHDGHRFLAIWTDFRNDLSNLSGSGDVYGYRFLANALPILPELDVASRPMQPETAGAVVGDHGITLVAYATLEPGFGAWRIALRSVSLRSLGNAYCGPAVPNSAGLAARCSATGSPIVADNDLTLTAEDLPTNRFGFFLGSRLQALVPQPGGSQGNLCLGGGIARFNQDIGFSGSTGSFSVGVDLTAIPLNPTAAAMAGETWNFQAWYRDQVAGSNTSNFTSGRSITWE